jgi:DNA polymerase III delta prime subunit
MRNKTDPARIRSGQTTAIAKTLLFLDRERETRRIEEALHENASLMICGPAGVGKTALILNVLRRLPPRLASRCLYVPGFKDLQDLLRKLIRMLYERRDSILRQHLHAESATSLNFESWLKSLSSSRLKGTLYRTVERGEYRVFLDHPPSVTHGIAKVIKELFWMRNTPVYLLLRETEGFRADHLAHFFYWGPRERLTLAPLPKESAAELLDSCIKRFGLTKFDLEDFREEVLELSGGIPGTIVKMCSLAAEPRYHYGSRIKTKLAHIDYLMSSKLLKLSQRSGPYRHKPQTNSEPN